MILLVVGVCGQACKPRAGSSVVVSDVMAARRMERRLPRHRWTSARVERVVVPNDAVVQTDDRQGVRLYMAKRLGFHGVPPRDMSIRDIQNSMGCAVRDEDGAVLIGTFGEWDSGIEGGGRIDLVVVLPKMVAWERRGGLSGPMSKAGCCTTAGRKQPAEYWWYGPSEPGQGWKRVADVPDPKQTASHLQ